MRTLLTALLLAAAAPSAATQASFVNWESPHVHPLDLTPGGARLVAVNTPGDKLEVFDASGAALVRLQPVAVGLDPVSVRARTETEVWVVNHVSDSVSVVDLATGRVRATLATDDEPCDVVFAGSPERAFVSCSQANTVMVFDPSDLAAPPVTIAIGAEDPRALAVSPDGSTVYAAIFESGNGSTILGGGSTVTGGFPPNVVNDPAGPWGGVNPPPNDGAAFEPPQNPANPPPPAVGLIVEKDANDRWMDDNGGDWTALVSGSMASKSGRPVGWDLLDRDVAVIDAATLSVSWVERLMNLNMALGVNPADGSLAVAGTDATNEIRYEPVLQGRFLRVRLALVDLALPSTALVDLNPHLDYAAATIPQAERDLSVGDPRGLAWNAAGSRAYLTGMGSNNLVVVDASGARAGIAPTIEVGEGPTGVVLQEAAMRVFVLNKFESSISVVDLATELEVDRVPFLDPEPAAIKAGRRHLYDTHDNSGLGQIACASCHADARLDRLAWDLGDPAGSMKSVAGQNLGANLPFISGSFEDFHPMKGPMLTQTLQDIIGKEPHHWRGDRDGLEEFQGAFVSLQGDDATPSGSEMQEFEDFLATIHFPPNPHRDFDNGLPTDLPLPGHYSTGDFGPAGQPLPNGDAENGLALFRPPNLLDEGVLACVTCHTNPSGLGTDYELQVFSLVPIPPGPNGEHHHALVSVDGSTNVSMKVPHLRNLHERTGFNTTQAQNTAGFGYLHDGSIDTIERFVGEPLFTLSNDQEVADLVAFMLAYAGSELPAGSPGDIFEPPGTASQDTHAAVGAQTTLVSLAGVPPEQSALIAAMIAEADESDVGLVAKLRQGDERRGYAYLADGTWQSDRAAEVLTTAELEALAAPGSELTITVVPFGSETRIGIDRDGDGALDRDELDAAADPADATSAPGACGDPAPAAPAGLSAAPVAETRIAIEWSDVAAVEADYLVERAAAGAGSFEVVEVLPADSEHFTDIGLACGATYDYRVTARSCGGASSATITASTLPCGGGAVLPYGCGVNPAGSLSVVSGGPQIGTTITMGVDNPLGTQSAGSISVLALSGLADPAFPCGTVIPGFGMAGPGASGEILVGLAPPPALLFGPAWTGAGAPAPIAIPIPPDPTLAGVSLYTQGVLVDPIGPVGIGLTDGVELVFGS